MDRPVSALWHGGIPGLSPGDILHGGQQRHHDGCPLCEDRTNGQHVVIDPVASHPERVYITSDREYARFYASMARFGDLYRVEPIGDMILSDEDRFPTWHVTAARVVSVYDRAVRLTDRQRSALNRRWLEADARADGWHDQYVALSPADRRRMEEQTLRRNYSNALRIALEARRRKAAALS